MKAYRGIIPKREPELIRNEANRLWRGCDEKVSTTSVGSLDIDGTKISSRYGKADELELMRDALLSLDKEERAWVKSIFCDSKATHTYTVIMRRWDELWAKRIGIMLEHALLNSPATGHNGIFVHEDDGSFFGGDRMVEISAVWMGDV